MKKYGPIKHFTLISLYSIYHGVMTALAGIYFPSTDYILSVIFLLIPIILLQVLLSYRLKWIQIKGEK